MSIQAESDERRSIEGGGRSFYEVAAAIGGNQEINRLAEAMKGALPGITDGACRRALFALGLAGYWPQPR